MPGWETLSPTVPRWKSGQGEMEQGDICPILKIAGSFPGSSVVKNLPANAGAPGDTGSIPGLRRSPGGEHGNPLQYSCLKNPTDRGAWQATIHRVTKSRTQLKRLSTRVLRTSAMRQGRTNLLSLLHEDLEVWEALKLLSIYS